MKKTKHKKRRFIKKLFIFIILLAIGIMIARVIIIERKKVTHEMQGSISVVSGEYTYKILKAYITNRELSVDLLCFRTENGLTERHEYKNEIKNMVLFLDGKELKVNSEGAGTAVFRTYKISKLDKKKNVEITIELSGETAGTIELVPVKEITYQATAGTLKLSAHSYSYNEFTEIFVSGKLPEGADPETSIEGSWYGFKEEDVYIRDEEGNVYPKIEYPKKNYKDTDFLDNFHYFYFNLPKDLKKYTVVISRLKYINSYGDLSEHYHEIELPVEK